MKAANVSKSYQGAMALAGVNLNLGAGQIHALVGENGASKSTLLKILAGVVRPDAGDVTLEGQPVYENPDAKRRVLFVPTECCLFSGWRQDQLIKFYEAMYPGFDRARFPGRWAIRPSGASRCAGCPPA